jgi:hypothetical protein
MDVRDELHDLFVFILGAHFIGDRTAHIIVWQISNQCLCWQANQMMSPLPNTGIVCAVGKLNVVTKEKPY